MTRPKCCRKISALPANREYIPAGKPYSEESVSLTLDEIEAIRLADYEKQYQEDAADLMGISRQTFGRIISSAHSKIADAIINGKKMTICDGPVSMHKITDKTCTRCNQSDGMRCPRRDKGRCPACEKSISQDVS